MVAGLAMMIGSEYKETLEATVARLYDHALTFRITKTGCIMPDLVSEIPALKHTVRLNPNAPIYSTTESLCAEPLRSISRWRDQSSCVSSCALARKKGHIRSLVRSDDGTIGILLGGTACGPSNIHTRLADTEFVKGLSMCESRTAQEDIQRRSSHALNSMCFPVYYTLD